MLPNRISWDDLEVIHLHMQEAQKFVPPVGPVSQFVAVDAPRLFTELVAAYKEIDNIREQAKDMVAKVELLEMLVTKVLNDSEKTKEALRQVVKEYEGEGTDIQVARRMCRIAMKALNELTYKGG